MMFFFLVSEYSFCPMSNANGHFLSKCRYNTGQCNALPEEGANIYKSVKQLLLHLNNKTLRSFSLMLKT